MERDGTPHVVDRVNVYDDVTSLYTIGCEKMLSEYPVRIWFKGELAVDLYHKLVKLSYRVQFHLLNKHHYSGDSEIPYIRNFTETMVWKKCVELHTGKYSIPHPLLHFILLYHCNKLICTHKLHTTHLLSHPMVCTWSTSLPVFTRSSSMNGCK